MSRGRGLEKKSEKLDKRRKIGGGNRRMEIRRDGSEEED